MTYSRRQIQNRIHHQGFAIDLGENWANEELSRVKRSRMVDEELRVQREQWALRAVPDAEEGEIVEKDWCRDADGMLEWVDFF